MVGFVGVGVWGGAMWASLSFQGEGDVTTTRNVVVYIGIAGRVLLYAHFKGMHLLSVNCMFSDSVLASARR